MESDDVDKRAIAGTSTDDIDSRGAVNSLILDYYKKFGRKRDLEQFFSLSTAQSDIRDTSGLFWRKMKNENDSSDSGGRRSDSSAHELCRISIRCSMPEPSSSQSDDPKTKTESPPTVSPPIIIEEIPADTSRHTYDESDDNNSLKSFDPLLDLSAHKPLSPTSSITSQRKLEWDSLADVGYGNESDRKTSGSSLSTLERLALKQQYSNNDSKDIGLPTCHSTPLDENENKSKSKKGAGRKMTKIIKKDVDFVEVNVPHTSDANPPQSISVNLTKHISFNVEKDGEIKFDNIRKDIQVSPEKAETKGTPYLPVDKEMQTSLPKTTDRQSSVAELPKPVDINSQKIPVMISLNTLRKRLRRKKTKVVRRRVRTRMRAEKKEVPPQEKSGEQLSEAESFEYMPGHMYNQNQMKVNEESEPKPDHNSTAGNKSSLESSGGITTDSSKGSKHSLTQDLEKCIQVLKGTLQKRYDDGEVKKRLIKEIVQRLLNSRYRDDETTTDFLSGLSFNSKKYNFHENNTTSSTSDANNSDTSKQKRPRKSILRLEKFDSNIVASSSQSAPNLCTASTEKLNTNLPKATSNTDTDETSKDRTSSDNAITKTSSEELYLKYLEALKREESYKRHLKEKEAFLKQKLGSSDVVARAPIRQEAKINNRLEELMKDLVRNNYGDGSGDASKLEGGSLPDRNYDRYSAPARSQRSHSVFTLSSNPEVQKKPNLKKKMLVDKDLDASTSKNHYCCCPHHSITSKVGYVDSSVQVNIKCEYDHGSNEKPKQCHSVKCPNCLKCERSPRSHAESNKTTDDVKNRCRDCYDKQYQQNLGLMCPKCNKYCEAEATMTCQKCSKSPNNITKMVADKTTGEIKYVCVCKDKRASSNNTGELMIYKCSKLTTRGIQFEDPDKEINAAAQCGSCKSSGEYGVQMLRTACNFEGSSSSGNVLRIRSNNQFSQTDLPIKMLGKSGDEQTPVNLLSTETKIFQPAKPIKTIMIDEATRAVQTEISFNPRIADPVLSDVVIINNCVQLVSEQRREKVLSSDSSEHRKTFSDGFTISDMGRFIMSPDDSFFKRENNESVLIETEPNVSAAETAHKDYKIPIQGTNMTLTVTLASMEDKYAVEQVQRPKAVIDQSTSTIEERNISVQCQSSSSSKSTASSADRSSNKTSSSGRASPRKSCLNKPSTSRSPVRSTYPKTVQLKDKKPLRRANTDSGKLETCCGHVQTEPLKITSPRSPSSPRKAPKFKSPDRCHGRELGVNKMSPRQKNDVTESPRKRGKPITSENCCQTHETVIDKMTPRNNQTPRSPKNEAKTKPAITESCCQTKNPDLDKIMSQQDQVLLESPRKQPQPAITESCCQTNDPNLNNVPHNPPTSLKCPKKPKPTTNESCCQTPEPSIEPKTVLRSGAISSEDEVSTEKIEIGIQKDLSEDEAGDKKAIMVMMPKSVASQSVTPALGCGVSCQTINNEEQNDNGKTEEIDKSKKGSCGTCSEKTNTNQISKETVQELPKDKICGCGSDACTCKVDESSGLKDPIINIIQDITRRYSKSDIRKIRKKKCFTEIVSVLNYLLETEESTDQEPKSVLTSPPSSDNQKSPKEESETCCSKDAKKYARDNKPVTFFQKSPSPKRSDSNKKSKSKSSCCDKSKKSVKHAESESVLRKHDKGIQLSSKSTSKCTESSDLPCSTDLPSTSDSTACRILNKIKKECEKYHFKRAKCGRKCEISSSTSVNCENCKKIHHCGCRHKCRRSKTVDKFQKKCVAYNLILQTSESMLSEETICDQSRPLQNIVVKVPKRKDKACTQSCKETIYKIEKGLHSSPRGPRTRSCPKESEMSSNDDFVRRTRQCTVREYLEKNRPDFVEKCSERQNCLKFINEMRPQDVGSPRLKMIVIHQPNCTGSKGNNPCCGGVPMCLNPCVPCNPCNPIPCNPCDPCNLQTINEVTRIANQRAAHRDLLSLHVDRQPDLTNLSFDELRQLAQQIGLDMRKKKPAAKFMSEREMKKHSEKIYKTLPEVVQKKEEKKKENIKKTNLLMANLFKKNLQKKTLKGAVNLSNYSTVIKI